MFKGYFLFFKLKNSGINPLCVVSAKNRSITQYSIAESSKVKIKLNGDYIIDSYMIYSDFEGTITTQYSYDYVPDHQRDFKEPIETYKDKIENFEEINY